MSDHAAGIKPKGSLEFAFGPLPIPIVNQFDIRQLGVGFRKRLIELQRLQRGRSGSWISLLWQENASPLQLSVSPGQPPWPVVCRSLASGAVSCYEFPREKERILQLLIEEVTYRADGDEIAITFRPGGVRRLSEQRDRKSA